MLVITENDSPFCVLEANTSPLRATEICNLFQEYDRRNVEFRERYHLNSYLLPPILYRIHEVPVL